MALAGPHCHPLQVKSSPHSMSVDHVDNARRRRHGERNNSKDDGEGLAGPTDGLIQRPLLIQEARIIGPHVRDGIVVRLFTGAR